MAERSLNLADRIPFPFAAASAHGWVGDSQIGRARTAVAAGAAFNHLRAIAVQAGPAVFPETAIRAEPSVFTASSFRNVVCVGEAPALDT